MFSAASDATLVSALLGREAELASRVPVGELLAMDELQLGELRISPIGRERVLACSELARRYQPPAPQPKAVTTARDAVAFFNEIRSLDHEALASLMLNSQMQPLGTTILATGGMASVAITPADIFKPAIRVGASAIVIAHNHPSGSVTPSQRDLEFTRGIVAAGAVLRIEVVDHVIVSARAFQSLRELQLLQ